LEEKIVSAKLLSDETEFEILFEDGLQKFYTHGDCCSYSWIEHLTIPPGINGATLMAVENILKEETESKTDDEGFGDFSPKNQCCFRFYETRFKTNMGDIVLEFRNSSNGYYGGELLMKNP
jgi:hypothetical protein